MAKKPLISTLTAGYTSSTALNTIFQSILDSFDNTLSRDGSTPNTMNADIDLNSNSLLNVKDVQADLLFIKGTQVTDAAYVPNWKGAWVTSTDYVVNDTVRQDGNVYICLVDHTSGTFSTDLINNNWELFASKGSAGAGTGDLLSTNNLNDVADASTSRANLGLGTVATENTLPIAKGGTGDTTASGARTNLGLGSAAVVDVLDEDNMSSNSASNVPSQQSVKAYVDNSGSTGKWELISRVVLSGQAEVDITWTDGDYKEIKLQLLNVQPSTSNTNVYLRAKRNSWLTGPGQYKFIQHGAVQGVSIAEHDDNASGILLNNSTYNPGEDSQEGIDSLIEIMAVREIIEVPILFQSIIREDLSSRLSIVNGGAWVYGTTSNPVVGLRVYPSTGVLASGAVIAYGLK